MLKRFHRAVALLAVTIMVIGVVPAFAVDLEGAGQAALEWGIGKLLDIAWDYISRTPLEEIKEKAEKGDPEQQYYLGLMYYSGEKVPKNYAEALKWFRRAGEEHGHAKAQHFMGFMYEKGTGTPQNEREAVKWYRKAAEQGHAQGQLCLGCTYLFGLGVAQDESEALRWIRMAARQGNTDAQDILTNFSETW